MLHKILTTAFLLLFLNYTNAQPMLIGLCAEGGLQFGSIIEYTAGNTLPDDIYHFPGIAGKEPRFSQLTKAGNKLYGITTRGGINNTGTLFAFDPVTHVFEKKYDFPLPGGYYPKGSLVLASNGKLYGTTSEGGVNNGGVIFEYDYLTNTYAKKADLVSGSNTYGMMTETTNGKLYGMTVNGGLNQCGTIFEYDIINNQYQVKIDLDSANGCHPYGSLTVGPNGKMYGMTYSGGTYDKGVIFEYDDSTNTYIKKIDLSGPLGANPMGSLTLAPNGHFYGLTKEGGPNGYGILFEYYPVSNSYILKYEFDYINSGYEPSGSLTLATNGKLYGTVAYGGPGSWGILFEYDFITNNFINIHTCEYTTGTNPTSTLYQDSNGKLYGLTSMGGFANDGTLFEFDPGTGNYNMLIEFASYEGDGPIGSLHEGTNGKLYGITWTGGSFNNSTIFEFDYHTNSLNTKFTFPTWTAQGYLTDAGNGLLYGITYNGGIHDSGSIFSYDYLNDVYELKHSFGQSQVNGWVPRGKLTMASNGKLYGTAEQGGLFGRGVLFEYDPVLEIYSPLLDFNDTITGYSPSGYLTEPVNGKLYGIMRTGIGVLNTGLIYEYDIIADSFSIKHNFPSHYGFHGGLLYASNSKLYGTGTSGGLNNSGVLYEYDLASSQFTVKHDFENISGNRTKNPLLEASDGMIYGTTEEGGAYNDGVIFQYDFINDTYTKLVDLESSTTGKRALTTFIEVQCVPPVISASGPTSFCQGDSVILVSNGIGTGHQWYRNGIAIPGANNSSYTVKIAGRYSVSESVCTLTLSSNMIKVRIPCIPPHDEESRLALNEHHPEFTIWYDPASDQLIMEAENASPAGYAIAFYDINGKLLLQESLESNKTSFTKEINLNSVEQGMYFVKLVSGEEMVVRKFVKQ